MVSFSQIPATGNKVPLLAIEVDPSQAGTGTEVLYGLMPGYKLSTGTAPANVPVSVGSLAQAKVLFGLGSMLERMCARWFLLNGSTPLTCLPLDAPSAGAAAIGTVTIASAPTAAGTITFYIAGQPVPVAVGSSDTATMVAAALVTAITASPLLPVTAANVAGVVTLTAKHKGVSGNDIFVTHNYRGVNGGEVMPAGLAVTYATAGFLSGGSGVPDWTAAVAALGDFSYEYVALPFADTGSLSAWAIEYGFSASGRWGTSRQSYGSVYSAIRGSYSDHMAFGPTLNYPTISLMAMEKRTLAPAWEVAAAYAAKAAEALSADPGRPLQTLQLEGILPALAQDRFAKSELNAIASVGLAIQGTIGGVMQILREQTTYQLNGLGQPDNAYELVTTLATVAALNRRIQSRISSRYPRHKLANDGTNFGAGQAIVTPNVIRAEIVSLYREAEYDGLVENTEAFKKALVVERSQTDPNRVDILFPPDLINQLRFVAVLAQFRLQYPAQAAA